MGQGAMFIIHLMWILIDEEIYYYDHLQFSSDAVGRDDIN